jgi:hypothetical protein
MEPVMGGVIRFSLFDECAIPPHAATRLVHR